MKFIKLNIQNFQSHKDTTVIFKDGLNVIVGPSDSGKSAIIRALRKLVRDIPAGKGFITTGETTTKVILTFLYNNKENIITREITASKNLYYLNDEKYGGFGREIPKEIQDALNMKLIELGDDDIDLHFTDQHDAPFMLKQTGSIKSRIFGHVGGIQLFDSVISNINGDLRQNTASLKSLTQEKIDIEVDIHKFPDLEYADKNYNNLAQRLAGITKVVNTLNSIKILSTELSNISTTINQTQQRLQAIPTIVVDGNRLRNNIAYIVALNKLRKELSKNISDKKEISQKVYPTILCPAQAIRNNITTLETLKKLQAQKFEIDKSAVAGVNALHACVTALTAAQTLQTELLSTVSICPICKRPMEKKV